jgi:hypothetical protein
MRSSDKGNIIRFITEPFSSKNDVCKYLVKRKLFGRFEYRVWKPLLWSFQLNAYNKPIWETQLVKCGLAADWVKRANQDPNKFFEEYFDREMETHRLQKDLYNEPADNKSKEWIV